MPSVEEIPGGYTGGPLIRLLGDLDLPEADSPKEFGRLTDTHYLFDAWLNTDIVARDKMLWPSRGMEPTRAQWDANPILLFNHDLNYPLGKVTRTVISHHTELNVAGVRGEDISLPRNVPHNEQIIIPLLRDGSLRAMSIKINPTKTPYMDRQIGGIVVPEWVMLDTSVVTIPGNWTALIDRSLVRAIQDVLRVEEEEVTMQQAIDALKNGTLGAHRAVFAVDGLRDESLDTPTENTVIKTGITMPQDTPATAQAPETPTNTVPPTTLLDGAHARSFRFTNDAGDVCPLALSDAVTRLTGARRSFALTEDEMASGLARAADAYETLGWQFPELPESGEISYRSLAWANGEEVYAMCVGLQRTMTEAANLIQGLGRYNPALVSNALARLAESGPLTRGFISVSVEEYGWTGNPESLEKLVSLVQWAKDWADKEKADRDSMDSERTAPEPNIEDGLTDEEREFLAVFG